MRSSLARSVVPLLGFLLVGCGASAARQAASAGDIDGLRASLAEVDADEAPGVAEALLEQRIATAKGLSGRQELDALGPTCAARFDSALDQRAAYDDELAAAAARLRIEAGFEEPLARVDLVKHAEAHWRAVGARSLGMPFSPGATGRAQRQQDKAARWRRDLFEDPAALVRRAALRAAMEARHPGDTTAVLEAARLDPDEDAKNLAFAAVGAIGTRDAVLGLRDLWPRADEDQRRAIVLAWAAAMAQEGPETCASPPQHPSCLAAHELQRVAESGLNVVAVDAALALALGTSPPAATTPIGNAVAALERAIDEGSTRVRVEAIGRVPLTWPHLAEAVADAREDSEPRVAVAAHGRLLLVGQPDEKQAAQKMLRERAKGDGLASDAARQALVDAGDATVTPLVTERLSAASRSTRTTAGGQLVHLGRLEIAARLLADRDPEVRTRTACAILEHGG